MSDPNWSIEAVAKTVVAPPTTAHNAAQNRMRSRRLSEVDSNPSKLMIENVIEF